MNKYYIIGIAYICLWVGVSIGEVGSSYSAGSYTWHLPLQMFIAMVFPFFMGYFAGVEE